MKDYEWLQDVLKEMVLAAGLSLVSVVVLVKIATFIVEVVRSVFWAENKKTGALIGASSFGPRSV